MISIVVIDDHAIVRHGVRKLLDTQSDFQVVAETGEGLEGIRMAETLHPDVMIVDLMLTNISGFEVTRQVTRPPIRSKVVIFSMYDHEQYIHEAMSAGAMAFVLKGGDAQDLIAAIRAVVAGHHYLSGPLADLAVDIYVRNGPVKKKDPYDSLTPREIEILRLAAEGFTNKDIAGRLCISRRTVELHRTNMIRKLGLRTPHVRLGRYAVERGLIPDLTGEAASPTPDLPDQVVR